MQTLPPSDHGHYLRLRARADQMWARIRDFRNELEHLAVYDPHAGGATISGTDAVVARLSCHIVAITLGLADYEAIHGDVE